MSSEGGELLHCKDIWNPLTCLLFPGACFVPSLPTALLGDLFLGFMRSAGIFPLHITLVFHSFYNER